MRTKPSKAWPTSTASWRSWKGETAEGAVVALYERRDAPNRLRVGRWSMADLNVDRGKLAIEVVHNGRARAARFGPQQRVRYRHPAGWAAQRQGLNEQRAIDP